MKLEAIDPLNLGNICVATVCKVSLLPREALREPKQRTLMRGVWQGSARKAFCLADVPFCQCLELQRGWGRLPVVFGRYKLPASDRKGQVLLL